MMEEQFISYFRSLAERLKEVQHDEGTRKRFCTLEESTAAIKKLDTARMVMVAGSERGMLDGLGQGAVSEAHECSVAVLKKCALGNYAEEAAAYTGTLSALRKVLGRMAHDKKGGGFMLSLRLQGLQFRKVGPYLDGLYGYEARFFMDLRPTNEYRYNTEDWL
jgi:hypothetical protein